MDRKTFIKTCSLSCLSVIGISGLISSCAPTKYIQGQLSGTKLSVNKTDFLKDNKEAAKKRHFVIVRTEGINYPIVLYRFSETDYVAMLLQCPHQSMELNVNGDLITCSAHGSEFNNKGEVITGPAEQGLKHYAVTQDSEKIYIHLT